jgi:hypothetical protein
VRAALCGSAHGSMRAVRAASVCVHVPLEVYGSARGSVRLYDSAAVRQCSSAAVCCNAAVCSSVSGSV